MEGSSGQSARGGRTVAVVDDAATLRMMIRRVIESRFGLGVVEGSDGFDAIRLRFADPPPVAMIINGFMPAMDGVTAIAEIRRREAAEGRPRVPIIFESGGDSQRLVEARGRGADAALTTPFDFRELLALLQPLLAPGAGGPFSDPRASWLAELLDAPQGVAGDLLRAAYELALRFGASHVGSEHVAMMAVDGPGGLADLVGRSAADLTTALAAPCGLPPAPQPFATPRAFRLAGLAVRLAEMRGHATPDSSDIVMALLNEPECVAWRSLNAVGLTTRDVEQAIRRRVAPSPPPERPPDPREAASRAWLRANRERSWDW